MPEVFADTGYWIALLNSNDSLNTKARELSLTLQSATPVTTTITTEMVLTELLNNASRKGRERRRITAEAVATWAENSQVIVLPQTSEQFHAVLERYSA